MLRALLIRIVALVRVITSFTSTTAKASLVSKLRTVDRVKLGTYPALLSASEDRIYIKKYT